MNTENTFATRLKAVMNEKGVGIPELSKELGTTYEMVRRYVMGVAKPREKKLKLIADYLGVSPAWLEYGESSNLAVTTTQEVHLLDNVKFLMRKKGISLPLLAERTEIEESRLLELLNSDNVENEKLFLSTLEQLFLISTDRLLYDDLSQNSKGVNFLKMRSVPVNRVPIRGYAQLGAEGHWVDLEYPVGEGDGYIWWPSRDEDVYALKCQGDSMTPRIKHGEYVIIEPNHEIKNGDEVLVVTDEDQVMVKIYAYEQGGRLTLYSVNENHEPINLYQENIRKMHYMAGIAKESLVLDL
ncbi:LexA family transcriptional regulator [Haemophilus sp. Marseille-Q0026]|uniref:LexA family transcriptional regulator n=1 Tax=Haemophilus sp. Marseille-Q0026 TaxID=2866580 RepID=UPI001CF899A5|nr:LexA family transcriptional regulator [Haemophilus sp. Marseille-Q0026]DAQ59264.1 MAG TPA: Repressor protein CI [Caudoviricetes sp.]